MGKRRRRLGLFNTQFLTSLISTTLVLILLGTVVLTVLSARNLSDSVKENIKMTVLVNDDLTARQADSLKTVIGKQPYAKSVDYISKESALKQATDDMGTDPVELLGVNPFTASYEIHIMSSYANNDSLDLISRDLKASQEIIDVTYPQELTDSMNKVLNKVSIVLLVIAALFTYISFALINNTVLLTVFSRRFVINTMKLVGASWGFIRRPFLEHSLLLGIISAILADAAIVGGIYWAATMTPELVTIITTQVLIIVGASVLLFGLLITYLCTYVSLCKYLRMNSNELYNI